jgi:NAD kinase
MSQLESALANVLQAVQEATNAQRAAESEAADSRAESAEWRQRFERERERCARLEARLAAAAAAGGGGEARAPRGLPPSLSLPPRRPARLISRRFTVPPAHLADAVAELDAAAAAAAAAGGVLRRCGSSADSEAAAAAGDGVSMARLGRALAAYFLGAAAARHSGAAGASRAGSGALAAGPAGDATISVADDGSTGVGATAAAAVSVALAQSWTAAGAGAPRARSLARVAAAAAAGPGRRARFKLVAAVPRGPERGAAPRAGGAGSAAGSAAGSGLALDSLDDDAGALDDAAEESWRASGSHLKMHWLSPPSAALVVYKPAAEVVPHAGAAVAALLRRGAAVYVEPGARAEAAAAARAALVAPTPGGGPASPAPPPAPAPEPADAPLGEAEADALLARALLSWAPADAGGGAADSGELAAPEGAAAGPALPAALAARLDLVVTLGGDGTVLWACSLFGAGPVPPVVPLALGSLGFMTPFPLGRAAAVLARVTSVAHGFPLMLRHRLHARVVRAPGNNSSSNGGDAEPAVEVLNEVVIDRGAAASLAVLRCYVDAHFATTVQGDGLILATPTGSTAYNLAAGGAMVHPAVPCTLFTPICPHTLSSRPVVFPEHVELRVQVPPDARAEAYASFDGRARAVLRPGDAVVVRASRWPVPMACSLDASHDWFLSVREGLHWNRRQAQKGNGGGGGGV